jgi:hypothetical protein
MNYGKKGKENGMYYEFQKIIEMEIRPPISSDNHIAYAKAYLLLSPNCY